MDEMGASPTTCNELADYEWLTGLEAAAVARELADTKRPLHTVIADLRRCLSAERTRLILELVDLRCRAAEKFSAADRMFFTRTGLEQATDEWVARYKAQRFASLRAGSSLVPTNAASSIPTSAEFPIATASPCWADLCCGIGGDLLALGEQGSVTGIDINPCIAHLATANARSVLPTKLNERIIVRAIDVEAIDLINFAAWHIDPDRRPKGNRTTSPEWSSPSLAIIERMLSQQPNAAVKLAPAANVPVEWSNRCELEWISRDRQCRQLVAWHGDFGQAVGQHRATILASRGVPALNYSSPRSPLATRTITGAPDQRPPLAPQLDHFIFDVDPAVVAARLTGALANEHGLAVLTPGPTYLTGPTAIDDAALACFEVSDVVPFQLRPLARYFRERGVGRLEIKKRGHDVDVDPEQLRRRLKLRGDNSATLLITRVAGRHMAIIARRMEHSA